VLLQSCPLCSGPCPNGHFHDADGPASHLCGRYHPCIDAESREQRKCSCDGACSIDAKLQRLEKRHFHGKRSEFEYERITKQVLRRDVCCIRIPPGRLHHDGPCTCNLAPAEHFCSTPCPQCAYRCALSCAGAAVASAAPCLGSVRACNDKADSAMQW
jgi:hypothetical protein